jgi:hypothetical protein
MQIAMKRNVIRRRLIEPKSNADGDGDPRDGGVQSVDARSLRVTNIAMGTEIDNIVEFEEILDLPLDETPASAAAKPKKNLNRSS